MAKILITESVHPIGPELLTAAGHTVVYADRDMDVIRREIVDADAVLVRIIELPGSLLATAKNLKIVSKHGVGYDNIDLDYCKSHGVAVTEGVLDAECKALNDVFFHYIQTGRPYVVLKYAMTLDGKLAAYTGASQWITGEEARRHVHTQRSRFRSIMVGVDTVLADDPQLTCRIEGGRNPLRIICDSHLRTPLSAQVVQTAKEVPTYLATCVTQELRLAPYRDLGCNILPVPERSGHVDLDALMTLLGKMGVDSVLLEGGATLHWAAVEAGLVHKVQAYIAPKILGGKTAKSPVGGQGFAHPDQALILKSPALTRLGQDILIESEVESEVTP